MPDGRPMPQGAKHNECLVKQLQGACQGTGHKPMAGKAGAGSSHGGSIASGSAGGSSSSGAGSGATGSDESDFAAAESGLRAVTLQAIEDEDDEEALGATAVAAAEAAGRVDARHHSSHSGSSGVKKKCSGGAPGGLSACPHAAARALAGTQAVPGQKGTVPAAPGAVRRGASDGSTHSHSSHSHTSGSDPAHRDTPGTGSGSGGAGRTVTGGSIESVLPSPHRQSHSLGSGGASGSRSGVGSMGRAGMVATGSSDASFAGAQAGPAGAPAAPSTLRMSMLGVDKESAVLLALARRLRACVDVRDRQYRFREYDSVFVGSTAVDWMVRSGLARSRLDAVALGRRLLESGYFHHVVDGHDFEDKPLFYRFYVDEDKDAEWFWKKHGELGVDDGVGRGRHGTMSGTTGDPSQVRSSTASGSGSGPIIKSRRQQVGGSAWDERSKHEGQGGGGEGGRLASVDLRHSSRASEGGVSPGHLAGSEAGSSRVLAQDSSHR